MADTLIGIPSGFTPHDGGECPVDPDSYVIPIVRTSEGLGFGPTCRAGEQDWIVANHKDGLGAIVAYRPSVRGEPVDLHARWPE